MQLFQKRVHPTVLSRPLDDISDNWVPDIFASKCSTIERPNSSEPIYICILHFLTSKAAKVKKWFRTPTFQICFDVRKLGRGILFVGYVLAFGFLIYCWVVVLSLFRQLGLENSAASRNSVVPMQAALGLRGRRPMGSMSNDTSIMMSANKENDPGHVTPSTAASVRQPQSQQDNDNGAFLE